MKMTKTNHCTLEEKRESYKSLWNTLTCKAITKWCKVIFLFFSRYGTLILYLKTLCGSDLPDSNCSEALFLEESAKTDKKSGNTYLGRVSGIERVYLICNFHRLF